MGCRMRREVDRYILYEFDLSSTRFGASGDMCWNVVTQVRHRLLDWFVRRSSESTGLMDIVYPGTDQTYL